MKRKGDIGQKGAPDILDLRDEWIKATRCFDTRQERFWNWQIPSAAHRPFFEDKRPVQVLVGGNKGVKTTCAIFKCVMIFTGIIPPSMQNVYPHKIPTNRSRKVRIITYNYSKTWPLNIKPLLLDPGTGLLPEAWSTFDEEEHMFYGPDGSMLSIEAFDPHEDIDPAILRGPLIDHTLIDEINRREIYSETRTRGMSVPDREPTVDLAYCPQEGFDCWTYTDLFLAGYDKENNRLPPEKQHTEIGVSHVSMRDNPNIPPERIASVVATLKPWEVAYRVDGWYSDRANGNPYFDQNLLYHWETNGAARAGLRVSVDMVKVDVENGIFTGMLSDAENLNPDKVPLWEMWEAPKDGEKYVMSIDAAEGNADSDFQCADIYRATRKTEIRQVAQLHMRQLRPGEFALQCGCMANIFGNCLVIVEVNSTAGGIVIDRLRNYTNIYKRLRQGKTNEDETEQLGWYTSPGVKGSILENLYRTLSQYGQANCPFRSRKTIRELMGFQEYIKRSRETKLARVIWKSSGGGHDDTVMAAAIAFRIIIHQNDKLSTCKLPKYGVASPYVSRLEKDAGQPGGKTKNVAPYMKRVPNMIEQRARMLPGTMKKNVGAQGIHQFRGV